ncbi:DUF58 domain-containing protein [Pirellulaceae bacterium SH449]
MTFRAKSLALICLVVLCLGMYGENLLLSGPSISILLWMLLSYANFRWRHREIQRSVKVERTIQERRQPNVYLWTDRMYDVEFRLSSKRRFPRSCLVRDVVPDLIQLKPSADLTDPSQNDPSAFSLAACEDSWLGRIWGLLTPTESKGGLHDAATLEVAEPSKTLTHQYRIRPRATGFAIFPGVRIEHSDALKWFRADYFAPCKQTTRVLPHCRREAELRQTLKTTNSIPQHGLHRQRKPGMGFELLELREYVEGDPPKSIAWKASARRDTLMIRQYESEVPIRLQLFIEGTVGCRVGSFGHRVIDQMATLATSVARIATSYGDAVGGYLIDKQGVTRLQASFGESGFYAIAKGLSAFSSLEFPDRFRWTAAMQVAVYAVICEHYPDLLDQSVNPSHLSFFDLRMTKLKRQRIQICNILAVHYGLSDLQHVEMLVVDESMAKWMQRFLCEHGHQWTFPMIPESDIPKFLTQNAMNHLIRSIQQAVQIARDNEVFVIIADLLSSHRDLSGLLQSVKVARARHHRVVVVAQSPSFEPIGRSSLDRLDHPEMISAEDWCRLASGIQIEERHKEVKSQFSQIGVPFSVTSDAASIPLVLKEVELARSGRLAAKSGSLR